MMSRLGHSRNGTRATKMPSIWTLNAVCPAILFNPAAGEKQ